MINPANSPRDQLLFSTVRIETDKKCGTAFVYAHDLGDGRNLPVVITNRHVVKGATKGVFHLHEARGEGREAVPSGHFLTCEFACFEQTWFTHPEGLDLCALLFQPIVEQLGAEGKRVFYRSFDTNLIWSDAKLAELSVAEDVLMIGYPNGLWDTKHNLPLVRRGITASHPALPFRGRPEFMVDIASFEGSSGSPVVLLNNGTYVDRGGGIVVGTRMALLGILCAGAPWEAEGRLRQQTPAEAPAVLTRMTMHLGIAIMAKEVVALCEAMFEDLRKAGRA